MLMVSLYDRLGGHVLRWSSLRGQEWGGATLPLNHDGNFFNVEITVRKLTHLYKNHLCLTVSDVMPTFLFQSNV